MLLITLFIISKYTALCTNLLEIVRYCKDRYQFQYLKKPLISIIHNYCCWLFIIFYYCYFAKKGCFIVGCRIVALKSCDFANHWAETASNFIFLHFCCYWEFATRYFASVISYYGKPKYLKACILISGLVPSQ